MGVIGIAGPMQSGKSANRQTFVGAGIEFLDLSAFTHAGRLQDETIRAAYARLGLLETINPDGTRSASYYTRLAADPNIHSQIMAVELPYVEQWLREHLAQRADTPLAVSWDYLHCLPLRSLGVSAVMMMTCRPSIWYGRILQRAAAMGVPGLGMAEVSRLIYASGMLPVRVKEALVQSGLPVVMIDTDGDDGGVSNIHDFLAKLGG